MEPSSSPAEAERVIPVIWGEKGLRGVDAVIDKDLSAALLTSNIGGDILLILADVEKVMLNFGKPNERKLDNLAVEECE